MFFKKKRIHIGFGYRNRVLGASMSLKKLMKLLEYNHGYGEVEKVLNFDNFTRTFLSSGCIIISIDCKGIKDGVYVCESELAEDYKVFYNYAKAVQYINQGIDPSDTYHLIDENKYTEIKEGLVEEFNIEDTGTYTIGRIIKLW